MKKWFGRIGLGLLVTFLVIQFIPVARTNPPERGQAPAPVEVQTLLQRACYDCHSNETKWPWYSHIAPASLLIAHDVKEGRQELNFSLWEQNNDRRKAKKLKEIAEQLEKDEMPLWYYLPLHSEATLSAAERELIIKWAKQP
jgi:hypothetical protein